MERQPSGGGDLRVISVNCAGGDPRVAAEALALDPDILLLQESPGEGELRDLLPHNPSYSLAWGLDGSILAKGTVRSMPVAGRSRLFMTAAEVERGGARLIVVSTRFMLPYCEPDLWRPGAWRSAWDAYDVRAEQMDTLVGWLGGEPDATAIVGGDFNTPARDSLYRRLRPRLRDAFRESGCGLGNTIVNDIPVSRIDQIWVSEQLSPLVTVARKTAYSDHRMVISDIAVAPEATPSAGPH